MAEYIERESLEEDIKQYSLARIDNDAIDQMGFQFVNEMISILRIIEKQPTADVVEVVKCKECRYRYFNQDCESYGCRNIAGLTDFVNDNDYCSYGEKKEGAEK